MVCELYLNKAIMKKYKCERLSIPYLKDTETQ